MRRVLLSWSSGKDSCWALRCLLAQPGLQIAGLLTTFNEAFDRVAMHAVRRSLVVAQAERLNLPLWAVDLPWPCSNSAYEGLLRPVCERAVSEGITDIAFGDLFLEEIRAYRERQLRGSGLRPLFPLWQLPTAPLAREMIADGMRSIVTCVDPARLDACYAGCNFDSEFLERLPAGVDHCGENGEFHTFVYDAPLFSRPIDIATGEVVSREGFIFADVIPACPAG